MYADYEFYTDTYAGTVFTDEDAYNTYAEMASDFVDFLTHYSLTDNLPTDEAMLTRLKKCVCRLAEAYKEIDDIKASAVASASGGGVIKSMSSGGESVTFTASALQEAVSGGETEIRKYLYGIAKIYLSHLADDDGNYYLYGGL